MRMYIAIGVLGAILCVGCSGNLESATTRFNELPPAVQRTVRAEAPDAEIQRVSHRARDGAHLYTVEFRENGRKGRMVVAANGFLLTDKDKAPVAAGGTPDSSEPVSVGATGTPFSALPLAAQQTILAQSQGLQVAGISRREVMGRVIYNVKFADNDRASSMRVAEDGALVQTPRK